MSVLSRLHEAALASDARADWRAFYQAVAGTALVVPTTDSGNLALADEGGVQIARVCVSVEDFATGLGAAAGYAELPGADLAALLAEAGVALEIALPQGALLLAADQLRWIAETYGAEVERAVGQGVRLSAPEPPGPEVLDVIGQSVAALGPVCRSASLVSMATDAAEPELVLVLVLTESDRAIEERLAETVTRAVQAVTDHRFAVACPAADSPLACRAGEVGIVLQQG